MKAAAFQLPSNYLPTCFQLPVFQLAMPIELARWKVGRTFHLARPLYRPRWHLFGLVRGGADVRGQSVLGARLGLMEQAVAYSTTMPVPADIAHAEYDAAYALVALRAKCPAYVPGDRWHQAVADATAFASEWAAQAQAFGWTVSELFGLHPVPEQPAANYDRLARVDDMGLIWLLRGRPVIALTAMEAVMRCHSGATLKFYRRSEPALAEITNVAPATEIGNVMQIGKPTLHAAGIGKEVDAMSGLHSRRKGARVELAIAKLIGARSRWRCRSSRLAAACRV